MTRVVAALGLLLAASLVLEACGRKGPPRPPVRAPQPTAAASPSPAAVPEQSP